VEVVCTVETQTAEGTVLTARLGAQIVEYLQEENLPAGSQLTERALATFGPAERVAVIRALQDIKRNLES